MGDISAKTVNSGRTLLIVDDYEGMRDLYTKLLAPEGYRVIFAGDGLEALEKAAEHRPNAIFMDLSLPVVNGWEATRRLKADPRTEKIPVVMLTAHELEGIRSELLNNGFAGVLTKPCSPEDMLAELTRILGRKPPA